MRLAEYDIDRYQRYDHGNLSIWRLSRPPCVVYFGRDIGITTPIDTVFLDMVRRKFRTWLSLQNIIYHDYIDTTWSYWALYLKGRYEKRPHDYVSLAVYVRLGDTYHDYRNFDRGQLYGQVLQDRGVTIQSDTYIHLDNYGEVLG